VSAYIDRKNNAQFDLFADSAEDNDETFVITYPECEPWSKIKELDMEKELVGFYMSAHPLDSYKESITYFANVKIENITENLIQKNKDLTLKFAGLVTSAERLTSKKGTDYGRFRVEDQTGSYEFSLFGENFMKLHPLLVVGTPVLVSGAVSKSFRDENAMELRINNIQLLDALMENTNREVRFTIYTDVLDKTRAQEFINIIKEHKGKQHYSVHFVDRANNLTCALRPSNGNINASEIFELLKNSDYVTYQLLK
jgi:DNA polymerase-3 subunit alpha